MPLKSKTNYRLNLVVPIVSVILLLDLLFLYYLKYYNQKLSLAHFNISNIGNILNLSFTLIIILGIIIYSLRKKNRPGPGLLISFAIIVTFLLSLAAVSIIIKLPLAGKYLFTRPLAEVVTGSLFLLYQFILFIFLSVLWLNIFGGRELLLVRAIVNSFIIVVVLFIFAFLYLSASRSGGTVNKITKDRHNVAVVLGAAVWSHNEPSPSLAARAEKAADLLRNGIVGHIQFTGGNAPGELSEAEAAYNYIRKKNVDTSVINMEKNTTSTSEQIAYIKNNIMQKDTSAKIIIVSDSYHLTRIKEICKFYNVRAQLVSSDLMLSFEKKIYYKLRESMALIVFWFFAL